MISRRSLIRAGAGTGAAAALLAGTGGLFMAQAAGTPPWNTLRGRLGGDLILPSDPGYPVAKQLQLSQFDAIHPQAVAYCESEADVAVCLLFAQDNALACAVRSGGHSQAGYSTSPGLVVDVSRMNSVRVTGPTVRLGPGSQGVDVVAALSPYDIQVAGGTCPTVAVGGWIQGGGLGLAARKFGMGCDRLVSADVVLADGSFVRASATDNPDLFWALRGAGGGNFGVVTDVEVRPIQASSVTGYNLNFAWQDAVDVILAWQDWITAAPGDLSCELLFELATDAPAGTEPSVILTGAYLGPKDNCVTLLDQLVTAAGHQPTTRDIAEQPYQQAIMQVFGCADATVGQCHRIGYSPEATLPRDNYSAQRNMFFTQRWSRATAQLALDRFVADLAPGQFRFLGLFPYGGQINAPAPADTAFVHRDALFNAGYSMGLTSPDYTESDRTRAHDWVNGGYTALDPHSSHRSYQNYMDPDLTNWREAYYGENYTRLSAVKHTYDPGNFFHFAQSID